MQAEYTDNKQAENITWHYTTREAREHYRTCHVQKYGPYALHRYGRRQDKSSDLR